MQLQDLEGVVQHIGARSTRIKNMQNVDIIVPNSAFLQSNVVNWTLSDQHRRIEIPVGVAYGSDPHQVIEVVLSATKEKQGVLAVPEPVVLFTEFGDNALNFRAYFWLKIPEMMERRRVESDVRYRIDNLFREAGIQIAFPQRDVHLDTASPFPVRVVDSEDAPSG